MTFIYKPNSRDRVFAEVPSEWIKIITWDNGCRHVLGGTHLYFYTATPNSHWRGQAATLAKIIVQATSGIAWDVQGIINIIIPTHMAFRTYNLMIAESSKYGCGQEDHNITALITAGAATLDSSLSILIPQWINLESTKVPSDWETKYKNWVPVSVCGGLPPNPTNIDSIL